MAARAEAISRRPARKRQAWKGLGDHYKKIANVHLRQLFAEDPKRGERLNVEALGLFLDYSKNRVTEETINLLVQLAKESQLRERIEAMFRGDKINLTEKRAVLHTALRAPRDASTLVDGENVVPKGPSRNKRLTFWQGSQSLGRSYSSSRHGMNLGGD